MTDSDATPISYMALKKDTPVLSVDGDEIGEVERVLDDQSLDLFDGITVRTSEGLRFADADAVTEITDKYVRTTAASASDLPEPDGPPVYRPNEDAYEKTSLVERVKDAFGDDKPGWKRQKDS
jgi:hypothetical protein